MADIKEYRNNELKLFMIVNVMALLYFSKAISFELLLGGDEMAKLMITIVNSGIYSSVIYLMTLICEAVISTKWKNRLVFWGMPLPGEEIFSKWKIKRQDERVTQEEVLIKYKEIINDLSIKKNRREYENAEWYKIYQRYEKNDKVFISQKDFLLFRDMSSLIFVILIVCTLLGNIEGTISLTKECYYYLAIMYTLTNLATRIKGKRYVNNVIVCDMLADETNENGGR